MNDFRKWLSSHKSESKIIIINDNGLKPGDQVLVRLSENNMIIKLTPLNKEKSKIKELCCALKTNGGVMGKICGSNAEIKVLGLNENIVVPRLYLRRPKKNQ